MLAKAARSVAIPVMSHFAGLHSPTQELGRCLIGLAMGHFDAKMDIEQDGDGVLEVEGGLRVVTNKAMRRWMAEAYVNAK